MRVVFMGTPAFAVPSLKALHEVHEIPLVLSRPDAVRGRGKQEVASPVAETAEELGLEVLKTKRIDDEALARIRAAKPDIICVAAYGCIIPDAVLELPPLGCINVHGSLLPAWRGAAPIQRALLAGEEEPGISIMKIVSELDAGAYMRQASVRAEGKTCSEVMGELAEIGAAELVAAIEDIAAGDAEWTDQDESLVTYAEKIDKREMLLDPADTARANHLRIRAALPACPARFMLGKKGMRATRSRLCEDASSAAVPGVLSIEDGRVYLGCVDGTVELLTLQADGKREMDAADWARGQHESVLTWSHV